MLAVTGTTVPAVLEPGDVAVLKQQSMGAGTLARLAQGLAQRGACGLVVHRDVVEPLSQEARDAVESHLPLLVVSSDWEPAVARLLGPVVVSAPADPQAALRAVLRGRGTLASLPAGFDPTTPRSAVVVLPQVEADVEAAIPKVEELVVAEALPRDPKAKVFRMGGGVVALTTHYDYGRDVDQLGGPVLRRVRMGLAPVTFTVGVGRPYAGVEGLARTYREALWAAMAADVLWGSNRVASFRDLGVYAILRPCVSDALADTEDIERLLEYDRKSHTALLPTMEALFEARSSREAAERLFVHRNTVLYRIRTIERVTGLDLRDPDARLLLEIEVRLARLRGLLPRGGEQPPPRGRRSDLTTKG